VELGADLTDWTPRRRPVRWVPTDDERMQRHHDTRAARHRQQARRGP
jgi:hypothetical protein